MYSCGPLHMAEKTPGDQLEPTYSRSVLIRDVALRTYRKRWTIEGGGERGSGISVLMARHNDDDDKNLIFYMNPILTAVKKIITMKFSKAS